jgi:HK97 family phage prohead protease
MMDRSRFDLEVKFASDKSGVFSGYGAIFGNVDSYGDVIEKGAFKNTLRAWEEKGKLPPMLLQHGGGMFGGNADDLLPVGKWTSMEENSKGLKVEGELFALNTERGQYIYEGLKAGALDGMSIGYKTIKFRNGAKAGEPRRFLEQVDLVELSIVTFPANDKARVSGVKAIDRDLRTAVKELGDAIELHEKHMDGSEPTTMASQKKMMRMMERAFEALTTGKPGGMKSITTIREFEDFLRDVGGYSHAAAKAIAAGGFKATDPRDEDGADLAAIIRRNIAKLST